jgi:FkbM family methyltransferase
MRTYIVIGAFDLISHDILYEQLLQEDDFMTIFVEPVPMYYMELIENCKKLRGICFFENTAISDRNEVVEIEYVDPAYLYIYPDYITGCSSVIEDGKPINRFLRDVAPEHRTSIKIQATTLDELMHKYNINKIDYLQIDTEGYDERIVKSIDMDYYHVKKLKFETHYLSDSFIEKMKFVYPKYNVIELDSDVIFEL